MTQQPVTCIDANSDVVYVLITDDPHSGRQVTAWSSRPAAMTALQAAKRRMLEHVGAGNVPPERIDEFFQAAIERGAAFEAGMHIASVQP